MSKYQSNGTFGEQLAVLWFREHGWKMARTQPETKTAYVEGKPIVIHCKNKDGVPDFTGYEYVAIGTDTYPLYRACEIKECNEDTMAASRLKKNQRDWMEKIDFRCAFVGIAWANLPITFEIFRFTYKGLYKRGTGLMDTKYGQEIISIMRRA